MNRNGVEMFVCFVIEVSQQHLPIWAQCCPVRGSPGGTRILLSVIDDLGTTRGPSEQQHGHGEDGGNHGGTKKINRVYAMFMGLMINFIYHRIFL